MKNLKHKIIKAWRLVVHAGNAVHCPLCGWSFRTFMPYGDPPRENAFCPRCHSLERHRLLQLFMNERQLLQTPTKLLHVAPEDCFYRLFSPNPQVDYVPCDLNADADWYAGRVQKLDLTQAHFEDGTFDAILCNHVLEHIPDDHKAMTELWRMLKPGGWAVLQVPMHPHLEKTYEDATVVDPAARRLAFGQWDHVRRYGRDYGDRLQRAGFEVDRVTLPVQKHTQACRRYGLMADEDVYFCRRPN